MNIQTILSELKKEGWHFDEDFIENNKDMLQAIADKTLVLQLQQTGVIRSAFAVIPDAEKLGIGNNKITAVFKHKNQAEAWAKSMWEDVYIIEQVRSEHFL